MRSVDEVLQLIREKVRGVADLELPLADAAGQVLAQRVIMAEESPPFDRAQLDGFAVRSADVREGAIMELAGRIDAGAPSLKTVESGKCMAINTGAPIPIGADAVLMVELSESIHEAGGKTFVRAKKSVAKGYGIQKMGSDVHAGEIVLESGHRLTPGALAICAAAGHGKISTRRIHAALLTTGDELVDPSHAPGPGQIRNSNHPMLRALLCEAAGVRTENGTFFDLGTCPDDRTELRARLAAGLERAELLVVCGGMSMGSKDLVPPLLLELGVEFHVEKVRMKPGKPFVLGTLERGGRQVCIAGLPGNPVSAFVTFQRFVRMVIGRMTGEHDPVHIFEAKVARPLEPNGEREFYQPCKLAQQGETRIAEPLNWKGSADLFTLGKADGLIIRPADSAKIEAGATVSVLEF